MARRDLEDVDPVRLAPRAVVELTSQADLQGRRAGERSARRGELPELGNKTERLGPRRAENGVSSGRNQASA